MNKINIDKLVHLWYQFVYIVAKNLRKSKEFSVKTFISKLNLGSTLVTFSSIKCRIILFYTISNVFGLVIKT